MPRLKFPNGVCVAACLALTLWRPVEAANPVVQLAVGNLTIRQQDGAFVDFDLKDRQTLHVDDSSGAYWPPIATDARGSFYVGDKVIDSRSGRLVEDRHNPAVVILGPHYQVAPDDSGQTFRITRDKHACVVPRAALGLGTTTAPALDLLKDRTIRFVDSSGPLVALVTLPGEQPADTRYRAIRISQGNCRVLSTTDLGNPDYLVELGWSPVGRWWIVGSNLNTLLRSGDGEHWTDAKLPSTISELVSAYVANDDVIWLAAIDSALPLAAGPLIVRSQDAGKTWTPLKWGDPLLREVPSAWLEGQMRVNGKERN